MPDVEQQFRQLLEAGQFAWAPPDLLLQQQQQQEGGSGGPGAAQLLRPQGEVLEVSCGLFVPDMLTGKLQLQELVMSLDQAYTTWYQQQVRRRGGAGCMCICMCVLGGGGGGRWVRHLAPAAGEELRVCTCGGCRGMLCMLCVSSCGACHYRCCTAPGSEPLTPLCRPLAR
jgi:hypothetical protein